MNPQQQELLEKIKGATNILVTVSANPSVDQLAAAIGMTLLLNKLKKHATAVFSGQVPSTIEFLKPEDTIEKNTDSLRDFIISLDKSKADKLRYKVEDQVVRIFISPYKTSITDKDLDFSQGDFNVDVVLCLGVNRQEELDQAITAHGRILHDAVVVSVNTQAGGELGSVNWTEPAASSLSELVAELIDSLGKDMLDGQIATSLLTGIVAETDRFSNEKTSPETMRISAELMAAGANQQLVASQLETQPAADESLDTSAQDDGQPAADVAPDTDGMLEITHPAAEAPEPAEPPASETSTDEQPFDESESPQAAEKEVELEHLPPETGNPADGAEPAEAPQPPEASSDPTPADDSAADDSILPPDGSQPASRIMLQPPSLGGTLTANSTPQDQALQDPLTDTLADYAAPPLLDHMPESQTRAETTAQAPATPEPELVPLPEPVIPAPAAPALNDDQQTTAAATPLAATADSPAVTEPATTDQPVPAPADQPVPVSLQPETESLDAARDAVMDAINGSPATGPLPATAAAGSTGYLNVQDLPDMADSGNTPQPTDLTDAAANAPTAQPAAAQPLPPPPVVPAPADTTDVPKAADNTPPPVPPPLPLNELSKFTTPNQ